MAVRQKIHLTMMYLAIVIVAFALGSLPGFFLVDRTPPITAFYSVETINSPVDPGGILRIRVQRDKARDDCPVTSLRSAVDKNGKAWTIAPGLALQGGASDKTYFDAAYPIPEYLPYGRYEMRVHLIYDCGDNVFHYDQPTALFLVGDPSLHRQVTEEVDN